MRHRQWALLDVFNYFSSGTPNFLGIVRTFWFIFRTVFDGRAFSKKWLRHDEIVPFFDFNGIKLPDVSAIPEKMYMLYSVFEDVLLFPCFLNDNYEHTLVRFMDVFLGEGPYGYVDGAFDVTVKAGDVVIDAGAWIGDFSAYAASKGAITYAFEPVEETFQWLCKTRDLNQKSPIFPIKLGLGCTAGESGIFINEYNSGTNSLVFKGDKTERITMTTLDRFVAENQLKKVDFIKVDIEGAERDMLRGASEVLRTFAPKLAICTEHLRDDPEVLEKLILEANPHYKIVHRRHKLMAAVPSL
ncbi:methyltransferase FkbM domain [Candidatus Symbiothrix dinenymphae]|nr:methyltransferase FkbM domain [Candidatus Symbiothrix dinenymphae]